MTIGDQSRYDLHQRLAQVLGADEASTLMAHLPPVGWADVATRRDLDQLGRELRAEMAAGFAGVRADLHQEVAMLRADSARQLPTLLLGLVGLQVSAAGLALALSRLL